MVIKSWFRNYRSLTQGYSLKRSLKELMNDIHVLEECVWLEEIHNKALREEFLKVGGVDAQLIREEILISDAKIKGYSSELAKLNALAKQGSSPNEDNEKE